MFLNLPQKPQMPRNMLLRRLLIVLAPRWRTAPLGPATSAVVSLLSLKVILLSVPHDRTPITSGTAGIPFTAANDNDPPHSGADA